MSSYYGERSGGIPTWESFEAGDDDEAVDISEYQYASRDHLLFCIDASESMHKVRPKKEDTDEDEGPTRGKSALHQVLESVVRFEKGKVITGPADSVGLLLFNIDAEKVKNTSGNYKPGTLVYQNLRTINAEEIKKIIKLVEQADEEYREMDEEAEEEPAILKETFPSAKKGDEMNIADVLVTCNFLFRDAGTKLAGNKRVFLVTDNDDPPAAETTLAPAQTVYGDLQTYGITVNTYFIDRPNHRFDPRGYWNTVLNREEDDGAPTAAADDGLDALAAIMDDLIIRQAPKRKQFSIPLKLGGKDGEIEIGVSGYSMISEQGKGQPKYVRMRGQAVEEVMTKTEYTSAETGSILRPEEIGQAYQFGHEATIPNILDRNWWESDEAVEQQRAVAEEALRLDEERREREDNGEEVDMAELRKTANGEPMKGEGTKTGEEKKVVARTRLQFKPDEVKELKTLGVPTQIKILGFQSGGNLKFDENIKHSYFMYPDEDAYTGSTRTFAALHKSLIKLQKHALALARFRSNTTPEIAVLIPQEETFTKEGAQDQPPGLHVICMPFADDMRKPPKAITENLLATDRQTELMATIVKRLRFKGEKYRSEAYPNPALAFHYAQLQSLAFEEDFDPNEATDLDKTLPKHAGMHKAAGEFMREWNREIEEDERASITLIKPGKRSAAVSEADLADIEGMWKKGKLDKLKVTELKDYAKFKKISLEGKTKKADLVIVMDAWLKTNVGMGNKKAKN
ncbi:SPOC like C-terminal domain-containing protein [Dioszegia hungarica]|uniref:ATP-dependent DNA helicase II subunit 1 n=1 Tax=Dioszegia hungarica TaxID=4972 RepID=A0AA38LR70_9TREE|nr:SPOC like C-terminal domain-containing protein [Dioszegia hungarica]KAI9634077.1 SPOC like C-terminal domain-containing protein [Dioszegia hungarica]